MKTRKIIKKGRIQYKKANRAEKLGRPPGLSGITVEELETAPHPPLFQVLRIRPNSTVEDIQQIPWSHISKIYNQEDIFWINIEDLRNPKILQAIGEFFKIDSLSLEDIITTDQRPKAEDYGHYLLLIVRMFRLENHPQASSSPVVSDGGNHLNNKKKIISEQVSFILGKNYVITFQEGPQGDVFDVVRSRIKRSEQSYKKWRPDYIFYSLLDSIIDHTLSVIDILFEELDTLEKELVYEKNPQVLGRIYEKKVESMLLRRFVWPLREGLSDLSKMETPLIQQETYPYLKDLQDHTLQVSESLETFRDTLTFLAEFNFSISASSTNEVMKLLTIFTSLFIPLTFITGIYGMNFRHMPELEWKYGYAFVWSIIIFSVGGLLYFFRR